MKKNVDRQSLHSLTELARISCTKDEEENLLQDFQKILEYVERLNEVDTSQASPCNHVLENFVNVMRDDVVIEDRILPRDVILENAPDKTGGLFKVPTVIKKS